MKNYVKNDHKDYMLYLQTKGIKQLVGQQLRNARNKKKLSQKDLAEMLGVDQNYISKIENGKVNIGLVSLFKVCQVLDCFIKVSEKETEKQVEHKPRIGNAYVPHHIMYSNT